MSTSNENPESIRVINEEYERVLSNPDNLIMSEELQELMELPMEGQDDPDPKPVDSLVMTIIDADGLGVSVRGSLYKFSSTSDEMYTIVVEAGKIRREFMAALQANRGTQSPLIVGGLYDMEISDAEVLEWSLEQSGPHTLRLGLTFRSGNVTF